MIRVSSFRMCFGVIFLLFAITVAVIGEDSENHYVEVDSAALIGDDSLEPVASESTIIAENFTDVETRTAGMPSPEEIYVFENVSDGSNVSVLDETVAPGETPLALSAEEVVALAIESLGGVETYQQVLDGNVTISVTGRSGMLSIPLTSVFTDMYLDSKVNLTDPAAGIFMVVNIRSEEVAIIGMEAEMAFVEGALLMNLTVIEDGEEERAEICLINDAAYTKVEEVWTRAEASNAEDLPDLNSSTQDFEFLYEWPERSAEKLRCSEIELMGIEEVEGELCYKMRVVPNTATTSEVLEGLGGSATFLEDVTPLDPSSSQASQTDVDMEMAVWISTETHLPKKESVSGYIVEYIPVEEDLDLLMCMSFDVVVKYLDYNQPMMIEVELPDKANGTVSLAFPIVRAGHI